MAIDLRVTELPTLATPGDSDFLLVAHNGISYKVSKSALVKQFLTSLGDIDLSTPPSDGQVLSWSATLSKWVARSETSGTPVVDWNSIINRPSTFAPSTHTHVKADITDLGNIASDWDSITNKPATFPPEAHQHDWADITNVPNIATDWDSISGKPTEFPPAAHMQDWSTITNTPVAYQPTAHTHSTDDILGGFQWDSITGIPDLFYRKAAVEGIIYELANGSFITMRPSGEADSVTLGDEANTQWIMRSNFVNASHNNNYAFWDGVSWSFTPQVEGDFVYVTRRGQWFTYTAGSWVALGAPEAHGHDWSEVYGKPITFPPEVHGHLADEVELFTGNYTDVLARNPAVYGTTANMQDMMAVVDAHVHDSRYYTKTNLSTSGQSAVHWGNITNVPDLSLVNPSDLVFNIDGALAPSTTAGEVLVVRNCTVDYVYMDFEDQSGNDPLVEINLIRRRNGLDTAFFVTPIENAAGWFKVRLNPTVVLAEGDTVILRIISVSSPGAANLQVVVTMAGNAPQGTSHVATHQNGGADELNVAGLSGKLADLQDAGWLQGSPLDISVPAYGDFLRYYNGNWMNGAVGWNDVALKPATFPPETHTHNYVPTASYTAADVLAKILTVDGSGSGLDADLLDGYNAASFLTRYSITSQAMNVNGQIGPDVQGISGGAACISFHRPSAYAVNFGLDTDNYLKVGGWSMGNAAYKIFHEGFISLQGATVTRNADQIISTGVWNVISWNTEARDTSTYADLVTYPTRVTVPEAGVYLYILNVKFAANATGFRSALVYKNGSNTTGALTYYTLQPNATAGWTTDIVIADVRTLNAGDYLECSVYQNSGGNLNITLSGGNICHLVVLKVA